MTTTHLAFAAASVPGSIRHLFRFVAFPVMMCAVLLAGPAEAGAVEEPAWFSDAPPNAQWAKRSRFAHGGPVERGRGGVYQKRLWYRAGTPLDAAAYPADYRSFAYDLLVVDPTGKPLKAAPFQAAEGNGVVFPMPEEGFYSAYLVTRQVEQGVLRTEVVKAEALKHSCGEGHDRKFTESRMPPHSASQVPIEILRERVPDEDFHTRLASGDTVAFRVLFRGQPAAGAQVAMVTERGWTRRVTADREGRVQFQMIRDYYPDWELFNKRESQSFLVTAALEVPESGSHNGQAYSAAHYSTSLAGWYFPSARDYESYLYGLIVMLVALVLVGAAVYFYRLKQARPSRERFDETA